MPFRMIGSVDGRTIRFDLPFGELSLGSDRDCEVRLRDATVSRRHATLVVTIEGVAIEDHGSTNGTFVDGQRVRRATAEDGSVISFGRVLMRFDWREESDIELAWEPSTSLPATPPPSSTGIPPRSDDTLGITPLDLVVLEILPRLLRRIDDGADLLELAQSAGADFFNCLPITSLRIESTGDRSPLFTADRANEATITVATPPLLEQAGRSCHIRVELSRSGAQRAMAPLLQILAAALDIAGSRRFTSASEESDDSQHQISTQRPKPAARPRPLTVYRELERLYDQAERVATGEVSVLIQGESGTGKEIIARFLHDSSHRAAGAYVALNCAALPQDLLEAELFGVEKGAATGVEARAGKFELADRGTLFLDEIGDMAQATQAKLLRVLQEHQIFRLGATEARAARVRVLAATNRNLAQMVEEGSFRSDLYHRIAGWQVTLPSLRERNVDIGNLAIFFLRAEAKERGIRPAGLSKAALRALQTYHWPGNIRQLQQEIARAVLFLDDGDVLDASRLSDEIQHAEKVITGSLAEQVAEFERRQIRRALAIVGGNVSEAAQNLQVHRATLYRRMSSLGLEAVE